MLSVGTVAERHEVLYRDVTVGLQFRVYLLVLRL